MNYKTPLQIVQLFLGLTLINRSRDYKQSKISAMPGLDPLAIGRIGASYGNFLFHFLALYACFVIMMKSTTFFPRIL